MEVDAVQCGSLEMGCMPVPCCNAYSDANTQVMRTGEQTGYDVQRTARSNDATATA